jgi:purine-binding chemotaxis protein CheW
MSRPMKIAHSIRQRADLEKSLVGFLLDQGTYAIPIHHVREIINPVPITSLPRAPEAVAGVVDHRGEVIVVVDLRAHFRLSETPRPAREKWILTRTSDVVVGLVVDQVTEVFGTQGERLKPAPRVRGEDLRGFLGVFTRDGKVTFVLDVRHFEEVAQSVRAERNGPDTRPR